jgi:transcriptional regulator with XRE-family HTH domain
MPAQKTKLGGMAIDSPLRRWRKANEHTQGQVAQLLGVHLDSVNRWEQGRSVPHEKTLTRLLTLTHLSADAIIYPERWLREHPDYLQAYAEQPPRRGRPPRPRPPEGGQE